MFMIIAESINIKKKKCHKKLYIYITYFLIHSCILTAQVFIIKLQTYIKLNLSYLPTYLYIHIKVKKWLAGKYNIYELPYELNYK